MLNEHAYKDKEWTLLPLIPWTSTSLIIFEAITPSIKQTLNFNTWKASDYDNTKPN